MIEWENTEPITTDQLKRFLSTVITSPNEKTPDRLKAASLLLSMSESWEEQSGNTVIVEITEEA